MKTFERLLPTLLIIMTFVVSGLFVYIATQRTLTSLEGMLLQAFALTSGLVGSFLFGKQSAEDAAREIIKPHARSAFRRLMSLYESLSRVAMEIQTSRDTGERENDEMTLARLEVIVVEQLATADDALDDWQDIVPEDVAELRARASRNSGKRAT